MAASREVVLRVEGMTCGSCTGAVTAALRAVDGVVEGARPFPDPVVVPPRARRALFF